ncbi:MAG: hydantoinase/oxoprolinase family protein, partial [Candidatus Hydrothermarchaeota archaeon]|nr:hydantoinase/oxoprolinase family protein [Candidatus Hydrothermarchaeota archaeon]
MRILTFDIGGANVKRLLYDSRREGVKSDIFYFPIWKRKDELSEFLRRKSIRADAIGVTMTAELSDAFADKASGVMYIVDACENSLGTPWYLTLDGRVIGKGGIENPLELAASNWVASRYHLEKKYREGIFVDVGSTTTDIIPFGQRTKPGKTDLERLRMGQLVYTGFLLTPVSAVVKKVPYMGDLTRISSEYFAITADVYNILGMLGDYSCSTPDGEGKSKGDSMRRIARHLC